ncbi:MAG TPA: patatin-like phospholipase family protein [Terriglobales bacterium]|nr:patatin-like phospholipase family protein [Terriglobales bacterium]
MNVLLALGLGLTVALTGCFSKIHQLPTHLDSKTPVFTPLADQDTLLGLAVSGGGSRAATFAAGTLEALAEIRVTRDGTERSALELVTHMSSVSGGSLATAYYAVKKPAKSESILAGAGLSSAYQQFFATFKEDMQKNFQRQAVWRQLANFRLANPTKFAYSFADVWDSNFFSGMTFTQLYERERRGDSPQIMLNGTIYNTGRRLVLTTLPSSDFSYNFTQELRAKLVAKGLQFTPEGKASFDKSVDRAKNQFLPQTFEDLAMDHQGLPVSLAVVTSASFPPVVGPVTYQAAGSNVYTHVGDGGLFDNLGTESLTTLFLNKLHQPHPTAKRGLILVIDASFPFDEGDTSLDNNEKGFEVFADDPSRIVGIMEERANAYQAMLWHSLRTEGALLPDYDHLKLIILRHTEAEWTKDDPIPEGCPATLTPEEIKRTVRQVPTLFKIEEPCHGALLIASARKVVAKQRQRIVDFLQKSS